MIRRLKGLAAGLVVCLATLPGLRDLASGVEDRVAPVRGMQAIDIVLRGDRSLCWRWLNVKLRPVASDDLDAKLYDGSGEVSIVSPYDPVTRKPWRYGGAVRPGISIQWWCVDLPPWVDRRDWVRLEQTIRYPSPYGPWPIYTRVPDVFDPGRILAPP